MFLLKLIYFKFFCWRVVRNNAPYKRGRYEDRNVLENIIFPYVLAKFDPKNILDIGREGYQGFYNDFFVKRALWTLDFDPKHAEFGAPERHITDDASRVGRYFPENFFDFILFNGVINWGLDDKRKIEMAIKSIVSLLKPGGLLIIGWNDFDDSKIIKPENIKALSGLKAYRFPPLGSPQFKCANGEHTYNFYRKD